MSQKKFFLCLMLSLILFCSLDLSAQQEKEDESLSGQKRTSLVVLPVIFYMPETGWGGGVGGLYAFRPLQSDEKARPSSLYFDVIYTQKKQFEIVLKPELYLKKELYLITANLSLSKFPNEFYGIGNNTPDSMKEKYTPQTISFDISLQKKFMAKQKLYAGLQYKFENNKILKVEAGKLLETGEIPGSQGGTLSGPGFIINWDTRDNIFFPRAGNYFQVTANFYTDALGSDFNYTFFKVDLRKYMPFFSSHVLALQALMQQAAGTIPFHQLPKLGGDSTMRGYYSGRYRDKTMLAFQAEYRFPVWKRLGMVAFAGYGDVADKFNNFKLGAFKYSAGWGIRYCVVKQEGTNLRLDFGYGKGCSGVYFTANEAF